MKYIFIHGLGQVPSSWDKTITYMAEHDKAVCLDLFAALKGADITYKNLYGAFAEYCDGALEPLNLCGLSLGAVLALNYAIEYPAKVQSLVLIGAQYKMPKMLLKLQNVVFKLMPKGSFEKMGFKKNDIISLTSSMMSLDFSEKLKEVSCKTLVACGEKDSANKKAAEELAKGIVGARLELIENAGHEVNIEAPKKLAEVIERFYETC